MPDPALRAEKLSKVYRSGDADLVIFDSLDFEVHRGEMLALVGESGAGKSTLLHLLGGLDRPTTGTIYYGSIDISRLADRALAISAIARSGSSGRFTTCCRNSRRSKM